MNKKLMTVIATLVCFSTCEAAFTLKNGTLVDADSVATMSLEEHFNAGAMAMDKNDWHEAVRHFNIVSSTAPAAPIGQEAYFWLGINYYMTQEYDFANDALNEYLKRSASPEYFQETIEYKYRIAERFRNGAKRRPFGTKQLPKWASGLDMASDIYDEVIAAAPGGDMAARALYAKAWLLWECKDFRSSIDSLQLLIKRFPKHELAPDSYVMITYVYLDQAKYEFQNPDILAFSDMVLRKFKNDFPREERIAQAEYNVLCIKELYAKGLYETGQFYERKGEPGASLIYYQNAMTQYPDTRMAMRSRGRLAKLCPSLLQDMAGQQEKDLSQMVQSEPVEEETSEIALVQEEHEPAAQEIEVARPKVNLQESRAAKLVDKAASVMNRAAEIVAKARAKRDESHENIAEATPAEAEENKTMAGAEAEESTEIASISEKSDEAEMDKTVSEGSEQRETGLEQASTVETQSSDAENQTAKTDEVQPSGSEGATAKMDEVQSSETESTTAKVDEVQPSDTESSTAKTHEVQSSDSEGTTVKVNEVQSSDTESSVAKTDEAQSSDCEDSTAKGDEVQPSDSEGTTAKADEVKSTDNEGTTAKANEVKSTDNEGSTARSGDTQSSDCQEDTAKSHEEHAAPDQNTAAAEGEPSPCST